MKKEVKNEKPALKRKDTRKSILICSNFFVFAMFLRDAKKSICLSLSFSLILSLKKYWIESIFKNAKIPEKINGVESEKEENTDGLESTPPKNGPKIKPSPKAAPIIPKTFVLFSGVVLSAIAA